MTTTDTIAALATPPVAGGLAVLRISGSEAITVAERVFFPVGKKLSQHAGYTAGYGKMKIGDDTVDDGVALIFRAPHSYTGEDVVEISCHGGVYLAQKLLQALFDAGARPAEAGEFTRRAYCNGKLTLTQAEAVADLISASGEQAVKAARAGMDGELYRKITGWKESLLTVLGQLAAWADYPDEDIDPVEREPLQAALTELLKQMQSMVNGYDTGRLLREGISTAIVGRPNVGKSTLMNLLSGCEKSIVTDLPGTTRDIVEETVRYSGVLLRLSDTAGLRQTADPVEQQGVQRARDRMETAALVVAVFDCSTPRTEEDEELLRSLKGKTVIAVCNKDDLPSVWEPAELTPYADKVVTLSAQTGEGMDDFAAAVEELFSLRHLDPNALLLANQRQYAAAKAATDAVAEGIAALDSGMTFDAVTVSLEDALAALLELSGDSVTDAVVDEVFSHFCVGK